MKKSYLAPLISVTPLNSLYAFFSYGVSCDATYQNILKRAITALLSNAEANCHVYSI